MLGREPERVKSMRQIRFDRAGVVLRRLSLVVALAIATVTTAQVPSRPAGLEATGLDQAVELRWRNANNAGIVRHEVRYAAEGGEFTAWQPLGAGDTSTTIAGLANFVAYTFQLRAVTAAGAGPAAEVTATPFILNIDLQPSFEGRSIEPICYRVGVEVWQRLPHAFAAYHYSVSPALPDGLSFNSESAVISGTPTTVQPVTTYTYTGSDFDGDEDSLEFTIKVELNSEPSFGDSMVESQRYRVDSAVDLTLPAAMEGNGAITYRLMPALPGGLSFDANTRTISGTPNEVSPSTVFTYTASDEDGDTATLTFAIEVEADRMPDFGTATIDAQRYRVGSPVDSTLLAAMGGDDPVVYGLAPALPDGLSFDANTRTISGTPNKVSPSTVFTYTATDEDGDTATLVFEIEVEPDQMPTFGDATVPAQSYHVSTAIIDLVLPSAQGGDGALTYALSPALPGGLVFNAGTRTISGVPTAQIGSTEYAFTATDEDGDTATLTFPVEVGMAIRVAVADAAELEGQDISFVVTLSDSVPVPVTVAYATGDGTALAGEDYAATAGTLTVPAGNTEMAIVVPVTADPRPEHDEQFTLALSELVNAEFADAQATGTIIDDDTERVRGEAMEHSLSVFGRAFAADAVDAISGRFQEGPPVATPLTFAGNVLPAESQGLAAGAAFGLFHDDDERRHGADVASFGGRIPAGAGFALPFGTGAENRSQWTLWGRGSTNRVSSQPDGMQVEGDINTGYLGIDARLPRNTLVGLAVARSAADFEYRQAGVTEGDVSLDMTTLLPYVHWTLCDGLDLWALAGSGQGEATLMDDLGRTDTDIDLRMAAFGLRSELAERQNLVWSLKADAFMAALTADAVAEALAAADSDIQRLRLLIEGRREWQRSEQSLLAGTVEFGARLDNGDADNGLGAEIGAAVDYRNLPAGIGLEARGRYLLAHAESAFDDWSLSVAMEFDPGIQGTGASLRLAPTWGTPAGDLAGVWRAERMLGADMRAQRLDVGHRMEMEIGYGFHAKRAGALEVFGALTGSSAAPTYRIGGRRALAKGLGWSVEVDRLQRFGSDVDYGVLLTIGNTTHLSASRMHASGAQGGMPRM